MELISLIGILLLGLLTVGLAFGLDRLQKGGTDR